MKKKKIVIIYGIIIVLAILWFIQYKNINDKYPNPVEHVAYIGQELQVDGFSFKLKSWEWYDGSIVEEILPNYKILTDANGVEYPFEKEKVALATVEFCKMSEDNTYFDITNIKFEMGAWHNQWDSELYEELNGENILFLELKKGEKVEIVFPIVMYDFQFDEQTWSSIEEKDVNIVIACYPEKYVLQNKENDKKY